MGHPSVSINICLSKLFLADDFLLYNEGLPYLQAVSNADSFVVEGV
jgi:hypothetical protein